MEMYTTRQALQKLHEEQKSNGGNNKSNTSSIVEILGGIDRILSDYLDESNNLSLTNNEILKLYQLLSTPSPYQQKNKCNPSLSTKISTENEINPQNRKQMEETRFSYTLELDKNNTILHSIASSIIATKIISFIDHKIVLLLLVITAIIGIGLGFYGYFVGDSMIYNIHMMAIFYPMSITWGILKHLSMNKRALLLCLKTFDYWIKVSYGLIYSVAHIFHGTPPTKYGFQSSHIEEFIWIVFTGMIISYIAAFDATNTTKKKKFIISASAALYTSALCIYYPFFDPEENDYKIKIKGSQNSISMQSLIASSSRIMAIFFWKQTFNLWHKHDRAISIRYSPQLIWNNDNTEIKENINMMKDGEKEDKEYDLAATENEIEMNHILTMKYRKNSLSLNSGEEENGDEKEIEEETDKLCKIKGVSKQDND